MLKQHQLPFLKLKDRKTIIYISYDKSDENKIEASEA